MRHYATLRRSATLKHKVLSGDASWKYFAPTCRTASQRRKASHISKISFLTFLIYDIVGSSLLIFYLYLHKILIYSFSQCVGGGEFRTLIPPLKWKLFMKRRHAPPNRQHICSHIFTARMQIKLCSITNHN